MDHPKIKPEVDVAIVCYQYGMAIHFSRIPDAQIVGEIYSLNNNGGIQVDETVMSFHSNSLASSTPRIDRQRLYYFVGIPPVFDVMVVGRILSKSFQDGHNLTVKLCDDRPDDDQMKVTVARL